MAVNWADDNSALLKLKSLLTADKLNYGIANFGRESLYRAIFAFHLGASGFYARNVKADGFSSSTFDINHEGTPTTDNISGQVQGKHFIFTPEDGGGALATNIPFENNAIDYTVGVKSHPTGIPDWDQSDSITSNPRTGQFEYFIAKERIGELVDGLSALPLLDGGKEVFVNGTDLIICVDELFEFDSTVENTSSDHSGLTVRAYLKNPATSVVATAMQAKTISYGNPGTTWEATYTTGGSRNYISIPISGGNAFGYDATKIQRTGIVLFCEGVTWTRKSTAPAKDLSNKTTYPEYAYIGTISGGGSPSFSGMGQNWLKPGTLDSAYDGPAGSGSGKAVVVDSGAIDLDNSVNDATNTLDLTRSYTGVSKSYALSITQGLDARAISMAATAGNPMRIDVGMDSGEGIAIRDDVNDHEMFLLDSEGFTGTRSVLTITPTALGIDGSGDVAKLKLGKGSSDPVVRGVNLSGTKYLESYGGTATSGTTLTGTSTSATLRIAPDITMIDALSTGGKATVHLGGLDDWDLEAEGEDLGYLAIGPGPLDSTTVMYTAKFPGSEGTSIKVAHVDPGAPSVPITVAVANGNEITVTLATDGGSSIISTADEVSLVVNADPKAKLLVQAASGGDGTGIAVAQALTALSGGDTVPKISLSRESNILQSIRGSLVSFEEASRVHLPQGELLLSDPNKGVTSSSYVTSPTFVCSNEYTYDPARTFVRNIMASGFTTSSTDLSYYYAIGIYAGYLQYNATPSSSAQAYYALGSILPAVCTITKITVHYHRAATGDAAINLLLLKGGLADVAVAQTPELNLLLTGFHPSDTQTTTSGVISKAYNASTDFMQLMLSFSGNSPSGPPFVYLVEVVYTLSTIS